MPTTIDTLFVSALRRYPEWPFMRKLGPDGSDVTITYRDASIRIAQTVERLGALGYRRGDHIACYLDDMESWIFFALSCSSAGVVMMAAGSSVSVDTVMRLKDRVRAKGVFTTTQIAPRVTERGVRPLCYIGPEEPPPDIEPLDRGPRPSAAQAQRLLEELAPKRSPNDPYMLLPTSGTTGKPKLIVTPQRHYRPTSSMWTGYQEVPVEPQARVLMVCSLAHSLGHCLLTYSVLKAAQMCIPSAIDALTPLDDIRKLAPTLVTATPRTLRSLYNQALARGETHIPLLGPACRFLRTGGAPPDNTLLKLIASQGVDVGATYGSTEATGITATPFGGWRPGWSGAPMPGFLIKLAEDNEILFKSPYTMLGYFEDEAATREVYTEDGYLKTGDFGELSPDGQLRVLGRKKDIFNAFDGTNIFPSQIEALIEGVPLVQQVALIGDQRPHLLALIVLKPEPARGTVAEEDGFLDEKRKENEGVYAAVRRALVDMNGGLDSVERVRRFALYTRPMGPELWLPAAAGKVRRNRPAIVSAFAARIDALYAAPPGGTGWVPEQP